MPNRETGSLREIADRYWEFVCEERPVVALLAGQPTGFQLLREAPADHLRRASRAERLLEELRPFKPGDLETADRATLLLLRHELEILRDLVKVDGHLRPLLFLGGPEFQLSYMSNSVSLSSATDAEAWLERLSSVPASLAGVLDCLREGNARGINQPKLVLKSAIACIRNAIAIDPEKSPYHAPVLRAAARIPALDHIIPLSIGLVKNAVYSAFEAFAHELETKLLPTSRDTIACTDAPNGPAYYELLIRQHTTINSTPDSIHDLGLMEIERLTDEAAALAAAAGYPNDLAKFREALARPERCAKTADALRGEIEQLTKRIDAKLPPLFGKLPRMTYGVESIPVAASERLPAGYAQPNPADNTAPGVFWITSQTEKCPRHMHLPLALHEAWPGHLMHLALIQEQETLPAFRRFGAAEYSACLEGWALYCERLGEEMGMYDTPQKRYGATELELWRAVRLVLDTGLHTKGWTREQGVDFAAEYLAMPRPAIEAEVDRYIAMPGQALAYQIGNLKFRELRRRAQERLGSNFRVRDFHDALMACGAVTLPILDELIETWMSHVEQATS